MARTVTPITVLPDNVTAALLKAANSQAVDIAAGGDVEDAQAAVLAAQNGLTAAQQAEVAAHTQATADANAQIQVVQTWLQSLLTPPVVVAPATAPATDPATVPNA